ncbi:alpha/beta hydrolase [Tenggerimyces flavus]|uniref:Alpha/beta hydrolase n=1 Tax=Tenggerimyces flavus TaxID=1708749 RepID=A0ABV7YAC7_9ACTN|nr:alpha/beta hydrolase [Tenggerimyces flavus]MBM7785073.1 pimeloyl-ACP methyl ester carboxylesterase [Tenggerimyces flavus]
MSLRRLVVPVIVALTFSLTTAAAASSASAPPVPKLGWTACEGGFECATAKVPLDYRKPHGTKIELALIRRQAVDQEHRIGTLFLNPGGPGGSGVDFVRTAPPPAFQLLSRFDWVGFDPRGVGASRPAIDCHDEDTGPIVFTRPETANVPTLVAEARQRGEKCLRNNKLLLPHVSTANVARDLDLLRVAVGDQNLTYVGQSYGTVLGATYASMFPGRARAMFLDSAIDVQAYYDRPADYQQQQGASFEELLDRFFTACAAAGPKCGFGGADPEAAFDALTAKLDKNPLPTNDPEHPAPVTGDEVRLAASGALYSQRDWPGLAKALVAADAGDPAPMIAFRSDAFQSLTGDSGSAVLNVDQQTSRRISDHVERGKQNYAMFRNFWWAMGYDDIGPALWPVEDKNAFRGKIRNPKSAAPILVTGVTYDPATPYRMAEQLTADLGNARLLTFRSTGHTTLGAFNPCMLGAMAAYLNDGTLPAKGTVCVDSRKPF